MRLVKSATAVVMSGLLMGGSVSAWAAKSASNTAGPSQGLGLIDQLASAKQADWQYALDPNVAPVTESDFLDQMNKADRVIKLIAHGVEVPRQEIAEALWVPPTSITSEERERLIRQLQQAGREDDHNEQEMLNDSAWVTSDGGGAPLHTVTFDQQKLLVDSVVQNLEIGEAVHWPTIKEALYVPPSSH